MMRRGFLALLVISLFSVHAYAQEDENSLDYIVKRAVNNRALLTELRSAEEIAESRQYRAKWAFGPKLRSDTILAPVPANADPDEFGENLDEILALDLGPFLRQSFQLIVPVYTFGRVRIAQKLAKIGVDVEKLKATQARGDAAFQAIRAYRAMQLSAAFEKLLTEGGELIKVRLKEEEEAREFGESTLSVKDYRGLQIFDAEVDGRVIENRKLGGIAQAGIKYLADLETAPTVKPLSIKDQLPPLPTLAEAKAKAETSRVELQLLRKAGLATALNAKLASRNWWPNLVVASEVSFGFSTENPADSTVCRLVGDSCVDTADLRARPQSNALNFFSFTIGLALRWNFDYWQLRGASLEAQAKERQVQAQADRAIGAVELEVEKIWNDASEAHQRVEVTGRRLLAARRWRDQSGLKLESGGGELEDAVQPLRAFFEASALNLQARFDYLVALADLERATGSQTFTSAGE